MSGLPSASANPCIGALQCEPRIADAIADAWMDARLGLAPTESGFCVLRKLTPDGKCDIEIERFDFTNETEKISFKLHPRCIAIFHTHPTGTNPRPSFNDRAVALKSRRLMYTISSQGIFRYDSIRDKTTHVRRDSDYSSSCTPETE